MFGQTSLGIAFAGESVCSYSAKEAATKTSKTLWQLHEWSIEQYQIVSRLRLLSNQMCSLQQRRTYTQGAHYTHSSYVLTHDMIVANYNLLASTSSAGQAIESEPLIRSRVADPAIRFYANVYPNGSADKYVGHLSVFVHLLLDHYAFPMPTGAALKMSRNISASDVYISRIIDCNTSATLHEMGDGFGDNTRITRHVQMQFQVINHGGDAVVDRDAARTLVYECGRSRTHQMKNNWGYRRYVPTKELMQHLREDGSLHLRIKITVFTGDRNADGVVHALSIEHLLGSGCVLAKRHLDIVNESDNCSAFDRMLSIKCRDGTIYTRAVHSFILIAFAPKLLPHCTTIDANYRHTMNNECVTASIVTTYASRDAVDLCVTLMYQCVVDLMPTSTEDLVGALLFADEMDMELTVSARIDFHLRAHRTSADDAIAVYRISLPLAVSVVESKSRASMLRIRAIDALHRMAWSSVVNCKQYNNLVTDDTRTYEQLMHELTSTQMRAVQIE